MSYIVFARHHCCSLKADCLLPDDVPYVAGILHEKKKPYSSIVEIYTYILPNVIYCFCKTLLL